MDTLTLIDWLFLGGIAVVAIILAAVDGYRSRHDKDPY